MSFAEFRDKEQVKKESYSFEAESDFCDWEMAITGIKCLREDLAELLGKEKCVQAYFNSATGTKNPVAMYKKRQ